MTEQEHTTSHALQAARERRIELKAAISQVEIIAASPSARPSWRDDLQRTLEDLRIALDQHVEEVEGEDGLLTELSKTVPRLQNKITKVRNEHPGLTRMTADAISSAKNSRDIEETRAAVIDVLMALVRHRQKGADLVYEGYNVDIGGG